MKCFKFVTKDLESPGSFGTIDYSKFGKKITVEADPACLGQCAAGIHVIPYIKDNIDWMSAIASDKIIILDIKPEDIVYQNDNGTGKMRVKAATPLKLANKKEITHIRRLACTHYRMAFKFALNFDKCSKQNTRKAVCTDAYFAYLYALDIDKKPTNQTRKAACNSAEYAYHYALSVDKCVREDTRKAACKNSHFAYAYAIKVDKCKHPDTWKAVKGTEYELGYKDALGSY